MKHRTELAVSLALNLLAMGALAAVALYRPQYHAIAAIAAIAVLVFAWVIVRRIRS